MPAGGQGTRRPTPEAPRVDRYGLHDPECNCTRCSCGYRPSIADRWRAVAAYERGQRHKAEQAAREAKAAAAAKEKGKTRVRLDAAEADTAETITKLTAPIERPATPDELAALRAQFPALRPRRGKRP